MAHVQAYPTLLPKEFGLTPRDHTVEYAVPGHYGLQGDQHDNALRVIIGYAFAQSLQELDDAVRHIFALGVVEDTL